jgi:hypothetical protein
MIQIFALAPDAPDFKEQARAAGEVPEGVVLNGHCIHPACLKASLTTSLTRMGLETVGTRHASPRLYFPAARRTLTPSDALNVGKDCPGGRALPSFSG